MPRSPEQCDWERWIDEIRGPLIGLLASWGSDWRRAEELAQDVFAEAWIARARFVGDPDELRDVGAWLRGIAFHLHAAELRRRRAEPLDEHEPATIPLAEHDERREFLVRAFAELAAPQQTVLRMHYLEETSAARVAALLGLTPKAVEDRLYQARRALREKVERLQRASAQGVRR